MMSQLTDALNAALASANAVIASINTAQAALALPTVAPVVASVTWMVGLGMEIGFTPAPGSAGTIIYRSTAPVAPTFFNGLPPLYVLGSGTGNIALDSLRGLTPPVSGATYYYAVAAQNILGGVGPLSDFVSGVVP